MLLLWNASLYQAITDVSLRFELMALTLMFYGRLATNWNGLADIL
jgi:hypothetical protein